VFYEFGSVLTKEDIIPLKSKTPIQ